MSQTETLVEAALDRLARGRTFPEGAREELRGHLLEALASLPEVNQADLDDAVTQLGGEDAVRETFTRPAPRLSPAFAWLPLAAAVLATTGIVLAHGGNAAWCSFGASASQCGLLARPPLSVLVLVGAVGPPLAAFIGMQINRRAIVLASGIFHLVFFLWWGVVYAASSFATFPSLLVAAGAFLSLMISIKYRG
jgi:hypothetical protein